MSFEYPRDSKGNIIVPWYEQLFVMLVILLPFLLLATLPLFYDR